MRIAVYHDLPSGGGKRALHEMVRRLSARHELDVFTLSCAEHEFGDLRPVARRHVVVPFAPLPLARAPFGRVNQLLRTIDLRRLDTLQRGLARQIDAGTYDVVFVHNCRYQQSPSLLRHMRTRSAYFCQEPPRDLYEPPVARPYARAEGVRSALDRLDPLPGLYRRTLRRMDEANAAAADLLLVNSEYSRGVIHRAYGLPSRVSYLGVDSESFRPMDLERSSFVLSVGALTPRKGFDFLIRALGHMPPRRRPPLVIVSNARDARELEYLTRLAVEQGVEVDFRRLIADEELVRLYNAATLTLYAPLMEPFGFVPLESMACATPVVGVGEAGVLETVRHGETGLLTARDPEEFADAVLQLLDDDARREEMGVRGRACVEDGWRWEQAVGRLETRLLSVAQGHEDRAR